MLRGPAGWKSPKREGPSGLERVAEQDGFAPLIAGGDHVHRNAGGFLDIPDVILGNRRQLVEVHDADGGLLPSGQGFVNGLHPGQRFVRVLLCHPGGCNKRTHEGQGLAVHTTLPDRSGHSIIHRLRFLGPEAEQCLFHVNEICLVRIEPKVRARQCSVRIIGCGHELPGGRIKRLDARNHG